MCGNETEIGRAPNICDMPRKKLFIMANRIVLKPIVEQSNRRLLPSGGNWIPVVWISAAYELYPETPAIYQTLWEMLWTDTTWVFGVSNFKGLSAVSR